MTQQTDPPQTPLTDTPKGLRRADGIQLIGEMEGSGYRTPPSLARRGDGQTVQLTPLLYAVLASLDGRRDLAAVAEEVHTTTGRPVTADNVATLVDKLRELGLAVRADGADPVLRRSNPLLALRLKVTVTDPERTRRITAPFARLFHPLISVPVVLGFAAICVWVLVVKGLASATHEAFARPGLLLVVLGVTVLSGGFHEFGHAAAARRGGADPGVMGAGLYLVWPAFYTDVTDSYRLGRAGRLRTDLGGLYFNAIVVVATMGVWWASGYDAVLLVVATQILQMLRQLLPLVRFDGYHVLADLTGVPDLFQRIGPTLRALVPWRKTEPEARALKPWARAVVTVWVLTVVPVLLGVLVLLVLTLPRIVGTALASADAQRRAMLGGTSDPTLLESTAHALAMVVVLLPVLAIGYLLVRLVRQIGTATWRRTRGRPVRRSLAVVVALAVLAALALAWWPQEERYRPVQAWEGGTLTDAVALARPPAGYQVGARGSGTIYLPDDAPAPTRERPTLAAVMVPSEAPAEADAPSAVDGSDAEAGDLDADLEAGDVEQAGGDTWIFPFDEPLAPDPGDNQALAANTTDETAAYSVAFALVWADGDEPLTNTNEAYAAASCDRCAAVAVAFQVVLVVGDANVAVPQNTSVAVNYDCTSCLTFSLAVQLFVTLDGPLSEESTARIEEIWAAATDFGRNIGSVPLDQIQAQLTDFEEQILAVVEAEQGPLTPDGAESGSPSPGASGSPSAGASDGASDGTSGSPGPSGSAGPTSGPSASGSTSPSGSATSSPSASPSASTSSSPSGSPSGSPSPTASATTSAAASSGTAGSGTTSATP
ncbi:hypothetical protein I601_0874 [Nocardioides dokdonensis FR1436]|uniref:Peptide zinc metalloprotease protein n=1 Tax=Nocardioides dokdonensis FR1436 TaxID=1300347 RepID=A0A1A9GG99_9ACTN|nr:hypothetical protein [Nocardioides dokdonensis]ANH37317.1 hypothetical protein I601_0874 [Nocardioides dokdonensis FR1436]